MALVLVSISEFPLSWNQKFKILNKLGSTPNITWEMPDHVQLTFRLKVFWHLIKNWNFQITLFSLKTFLVCPKGTTNKKLHCKKNPPMYVAQKKICLLKVLGSKRQRLWSSSSKTVVQGRSMCCISQFVGQKKIFTHFSYYDRATWCELPDPAILGYCNCHDPFFSSKKYTYKGYSKYLHF